MDFSPAWTPFYFELFELYLVFIELYFILI